MSMTVVLAGVGITGTSASFACLFAWLFFGSTMRRLAKSVFFVVGVAMWLAAVVALFLLAFHEAAVFWGLM